MFSALLFCCIFTLTILWLAYTHYFKPYYVVKRRIRLDGPQPKFYSGNYWEMEKLGFLDIVKKWTSQYGPTFVTYLGIKPMIVSEDAEIVKSVLVKNFDCFVNRPNLFPLLSKADSLDLRDEHWDKIRRALTPAFSNKKMRMMSPLIQKSCEKLRNKMAAMSDTNSSVNVGELFKMFTMEVILSTAFSRDIGQEYNQDNPLSKAVTNIFILMTSSLNAEKVTMITSHFPWSMPLLRFFARKSVEVQSWDYVEETALKLIEDRRNAMATTGSTAKDLLQSMLEAHDENKSGGYLTNERIVATIMNIILAGYETISSALSYTAYLLALNPTIQDKLIKKINDYYEANPDCSLYDAAENIEYVNMVVSESMRIFPPGPISSRECNETCAVADGLIIEKGSSILFPMFVLHHNPKYWPNPDKFDPERFNPSNAQSFPTFAYIPFGEGPRICLGKRLALVEAKMTLVAILKEMHFRRCADTEVPLRYIVGVRDGVKLNIVSNSV